MSKVTSRKKKKPRLYGYLEWEKEAQRCLTSMSIGDAIGELVSILGYKERLAEQGAITNWERAVGERIAEQAVPRSIKNGILKVKVKSPAWRQELMFIKEEIRSKLNNELGESVVSEIKFS